MSELIRRDDVRREIQESYNKGIFSWRDGQDLMDRITALPTVAASPWHRVEDGLPDKYTQCLVADADGKCAVGYYRYDCGAWDSPAFGWVEAEDRMYIDYMPMGIGKVVAWMPIEPPKEDA